MTRSLLDFVMQRTWLLEQSTLQNLVSVVQRHDSGQKLSAEDVHAIVEAREQERSRPLPAGFQVENGVAVVPISGVIAKFSSQVNGSSQPRGTSIEAIRNGMRQALADDTVETIVLDVDSPGGSADGVPEMADEIYEARSEKRIVAVTDGMIGSAAYFLASQAHEIVATKGAEIGSIGTYAVLVESRRAAEQQGLDVHVLRTGKFKGVGVPGTAITDEQKANIQGRVESINDFFIEAVARGRGISGERARELADGSVHLAADAVEMGLADSIGLPMEVITSAQRAVVERRGFRSGAPEENPNPEAATTPKEETMTEPVTETLTAETVAAEHPTIAEQFRQEGREEGVQGERARIAAIRSAAGPGQEALVDTLIEQGANELEAFKQINAGLKSMQADALASVRNASTSVNTPPTDEGGDNVETHSFEGDDDEGEADPSQAALAGCPVPQQDDAQRESIRAETWAAWQAEAEPQKAFQCREFKSYFLSECNRRKNEGRF